MLNKYAQVLCFIRLCTCRLIARVPDVPRKAEEYAAIGMFQEAAETAATVSYLASQ